MGNQLGPCLCVVVLEGLVGFHLLCNIFAIGPKFEKREKVEGC